MDVDQIATFVAIAQTGGFTRAAGKLHRSQPAVSRRLSLLEQELGAPLLERVRGGVRLTDLGRAFLPHAEAMLAAMYDGRNAVSESLREGSGEVSLALVGTLVNRQRVTILRDFARAGHGSRLALRTAASPAISQLVRRGEATLGLRYFVDDDPELVCSTLGKESMLVVAAPDHPLSERAELQLADLSSERWIGFPIAKNSPFGQLLQRQLVLSGLRGAEVMIVDSLSAHKRLVEAGFGLALLPESSVQEELELGTLKRLDVPVLPVAIPITLIHRRNGYLSPVAQALLTLLGKLSWR
jgi:DNA-binding transcriptional LysR family regulator